MPSITGFQVVGECGNGLCEPEFGENPLTCPQDCGSPPPVCGNDVCESGETCSSCAKDCGSCPPGPVGGNGGGDTGEEGQEQEQPPPGDVTDIPPTIITLPPLG